MSESRFASNPRTVLLVSCIVIVSASGCLGLSGNEPTESDPRAERVQERALATMANVSTYEATMSMTVETDEGSFHAETVGAANETSRRMSFDMTIELPDGDTREATAYIVNQTRYSQRGGRWVAEDVSDQQIWNHDRLQQQQRLLKDATVTFEGNETVDGVQTYVVKSYPDDAAVKKVFRNSPNDAASLDEVSIKEFSITHYIGHDEHHLRKVRLDMTIEQQGETADLTMTVTFSRYNEPITIDLPAGVESSESQSSVLMAGFPPVQ
jgi:outer membrane lipoprotein-sorting protein